MALGGTIGVKQGTSIEVFWSEWRLTFHNPQEYLYKLTESVRRLAPESHDSHLFALEVRCTYHLSSFS